MEEFLNYLLPQLIDNKEQFSVTKSETDGVIYFTIGLAKEDMGKIIGKEGKIINSIRNLLKVLAVKEKKRVVLQLAEPKEL